MTEDEADEIRADAINTLLDDLEQDVIGEMKANDDEAPETNYAEAWGDGYSEALDWVLERLKTYRRE